MTAWGPDTPWRQGSILTAESATRLGLSKKDDNPETIVLVVSHDCDLAHPDLTLEPEVEVIVGHILNTGAAQGQFTEAKHPRRLHLGFTAGTNKIAGDFIASRKTTIKKSDLADDPATSVKPNPDELSALQRWLSARYRRATFPSEFNKRIDPIKDKLGKIMDRTGCHVTGIFFAVDKGNDVERNGEDDVYELKIFLLENSESDPGEAKKTLSSARSQIRDLFRKEFKKGVGYKFIELEDVYPTSDQLMTIRQSWRLREWLW
jgi:hypothetical protein